MKYAFIREHRGEFRIVRICGVLQVSRSGFYGWLTRPASARTVADRVLAVRIAALHHQTRRVYGAVKLWRALQDAGIAAANTGWPACGARRGSKPRGGDASGS